MSDIKISIIMPVYKVEEYVGKAIESILAQTFTEFEFLIVDDGTPDRSGEICDQYAKKDQRIQVIHKENGGAPSARNTAIDIAQGKYVYFLDSDDWAEPQMLADMYELAEKHQAQLVDRIICQKKSEWTTGCLPMQKIFGKRHTGILTETCCIHRGINCTAWM